MKKSISNIRYITHLLLMGLFLCLFLSTMVAGDRVYAMNGVETRAIELASAIGVADVSMVKSSPCTGESLFPLALAAEGTKTATEDALEFKDRYTVCSKTVDKGCLIVGLTETRK